MQVNRPVINHVFGLKIKETGNVIEESLIINQLESSN
jgi:hypothetical protein